MLVSELVLKVDGLPHPGLDAVGGGEGILEDGRYRLTLQFLPVWTVERAGTSHTAATTSASFMCFSVFVFVCLFVSVFELTRVDTYTESHMCL